MTDWTKPEAYMVGYHILLEKLLMEAREIQVFHHPVITVYNPDGTKTILNGKEIGKE